MTDADLIRELRLRATASEDFFARAANALEERGAQLERVNAAAVQECSRLQCANRGLGEQLGFAHAGWKKDCESMDEVLRYIGLDPERCRTEGGALNVSRTKTLWEEGPLTHLQNLMDAALASPTATKTKREEQSDV